MKIAIITDIYLNLAVLHALSERFDEPCLSLIPFWNNPTNSSQQAA
jgi:hypothetical protein